MCNWNRCMRILMGFPGFLSGASKIRMVVFHKGSQTVSQGSYGFHRL